MHKRVCGQSRSVVQIAFAIVLSAVFYLGRSRNIRAPDVQFAANNFRKCRVKIAVRACHIKVIYSGRNLFPGSIQNIKPFAVPETQHHPVPFN